MDTPIGTVTMYPKLERREWVFGTAPDPRDARIAELEAALRKIYATCDDWPLSPSSRIDAIRNIAKGALVPPPEGDMHITHEELDA